MNDNWADRIKDLESTGMSLKAIASEIGLAISTVSDIKAGRTAEPRGMSAVQLHELHKRAMTKAAKGRAA